MVSTDLDNINFEAFLKGRFDCVFFQCSAPSPSALRIDSFRDTSYPFSSQVLIWNREFNWEPTVQHYPTPDQYCLINTSNAPLIEFIKCIPNYKVSGRLYWAKHFTDGPLLYDVDKFEVFYNTVMLWLVKNAAGKIKESGTNLYYMPEAWEGYQLGLQDNR